LQLRVIEQVLAHRHRFYGNRNFNEKSSAAKVQMAALLGLLVVLFFSETAKRAGTLRRVHLGLPKKLP
jgi:hypothetical protein